MNTTKAHPSNSPKNYLPVPFIQDPVKPVKTGALAGHVVVSVHRFPAPAGFRVGFAGRKNALRISVKIAQSLQIHRAEGN